MSKSLNPAQRRALGMIADAIIETIRDAGQLGAPGGVIYAALSAQGCTFNQYTSIMGALVSIGRVTMDGDCYVFVQQPQRQAAE